MWVKETTICRMVLSHRLDLKEQCLLGSRYANFDVYNTQIHHVRR
jgi:hypothetical protein